jgi:dihydrofolate reductase
MTKIRANLAVSLDGFAAGPNQSAEHPFGDGVGETLHRCMERWMFEDAENNKEEIDGHVSATAFIMGRNMFGPIRGEWDAEWNGWWGPNPPYHAPVYVLTHHARESVEMEGGTTFHFVTDGIESALEQARAAAGDGDVLVAGGVTTVNQYLAAGLIDELRLHVVPVVLGAGERIFDGVGELTLEPISTRATKFVTHLTYQPKR